MTDKKVPARFYRNEAGNEPVRDWLKSLGQSERYLIGTDIQNSRVRLAYRNANL
jgi:hypothetical protein